MAALADRKGDDELALQTYTRLDHEFGPDERYAFKLGIIYYARTDFDRSLAVLDVAKRVATPADSDFWRLYAAVAALNQNDPAAKEAYRKLMQGSHATPDDMSVMISLFDDAPLEAGRLAESAYRTTGREHLLELAVYYYTRAHATARIASLLASLDASKRAEAEKSPGFLLARAQYLRDAGDTAGALRDVHTALALAPGNSEARGSDVGARRTRQRCRAARSA
jgi:tetratricopeptide (TPR) repeat protein